MLGHHHFLLVPPTTKGAPLVQPLSSPFFQKISQVCFSNPLLHLRHKHYRLNKETWSKLNQTKTVKLKTKNEPYCFTKALDRCEEMREGDNTPAALGEQEIRTLEWERWREKTRETAPLWRENTQTLKFLDPNKNITNFALGMSKHISPCNLLARPPHFVPFGPLCSSLVFVLGPTLKSLKAHSTCFYFWFNLIYFIVLK